MMNDSELAADTVALIALDRDHDPGLNPGAPCFDGDHDAPIWGLYSAAEDGDGEWDVTCHGSGLTYDAAFGLAVQLGLGISEYWVY
jgi:hypothetical protein